jgi:hypothetical protein
VFERAFWAPVTFASGRPQSAGRMVDWRAVIAITWHIDIYRYVDTADRL